VKNDVRNMVRPERGQGCASARFAVEGDYREAISVARRDVPIRVTSPRFFDRVGVGE